jgi:uncharacterized protein (DUF1697 family)
MSTRHAALLRGINVGTAHKVPMAALRELLQDLGHEDVVTHLQSGNVLLSSPAKPADLERDLQKAISARFGFDVPVLVRSRAQLAKVVKGNPFPDAVSEPSRYFVTFLSAPPARERLRAVDPADHEPDRFSVAGKEIYMWCPKGLHLSKLPQALSDKRLGVTTTTRNWNTVTKLLQLLEP